GYCSSEPRVRMVRRFLGRGRGKGVILLRSDLDPGGEGQPHSLAQRIHDRLHHPEQRNAVGKGALTPPQRAERERPPKMEAKETSSRYDGFVARNGTAVHELEAVHPQQLQDMLRGAIEGVLDMDAFRAEVEAEKRDWAQLTARRKAALELLGDMGNDQTP